ncbi:unnamed protein product [Cochlearia groenlandica]
MSKISFFEDDKKGGLEDALEEDPIGEIYKIIRERALILKTRHVRLTSALDWISEKKYNKEQLDLCLIEYGDLNAWMYDGNHIIYI